MTCLCCPVPSGDRANPRSSLHGGSPLTHCRLKDIGTYECLTPPSPCPPPCFNRRVQVDVSRVLGVAATSFSKKDALAFRLAVDKASEIASRARVSPS